MSHPLHPALVHFPVACWSLATLADGVALLWQPTHLQPLAALLLVTGCAMGLLAAIAGFVEFLKLGDGHPAERTAQCHMGLALCSECLYAGSLALRIEGHALVAPTAWALALSGMGLVTLLLTGWLGGKLVYGYGVGTGREGA